MKNLSKVLAVVLALMMVLGTVSFAAFTDVDANSSDAEAINVLASLDLLQGYEDGTFGPEKTITRAEFAAVVCRMAALESAAAGATGATQFTDVAADHWATGYINLATQQGIIAGMGDGTFAPEDPVTFEQAVKMIVAALGYTPMANANGGYPSGYLVVAAQNGVTSGVSGKAGEAANRGSVAKMVYNALEVPIMIQTGFGNNENWEAGDDMMLDKLNVTKVEAVVDAVKGSTDSSNMRDDEVKLDIKKQVVADEGKVYYAEPSNYLFNIDTNMTVKIGDTNIKDYLDHYVVAYISDIDDSDLATVKAVALKNGRNDVLELESDDIVLGNRTGLGSNSYRLEYYTDKESGKTSTVDIATIADDLKLYVNGRETDPSQVNGVGADAKDFFKYYIEGAENLDYELTLLNNTSSDDRYTVAFVTTYDIYVVDSVNANNYRVTGKNGSIYLDEEDTDYSFTIMKDGQQVSFADIQVDDVLTVSGTFNDRYLEYGTVTITTEKVEGTISEYNSDDQEVTIDGKVYEFTDDVEASKMQAGNEGVYYIDARGKIVYVGNSISSTKLMFVTKIANTTGMNGSVEIRGMDMEGNWNTYYAASRVAFDGDNSTIEVQEVADATKEQWGYSSETNRGIFIVNKVIAYGLNSSGEINKYNANPERNETTDRYNFTYRDIDANDDYSASTYSIGGVFLAENTVIISYDGASTDELDDSDVSVASRDSLVDGTKASGPVTAYNINTDGEAVCIVGPGLVGGMDWGTNMMTVDSVVDTQNDRGETVQKIVGLQGGESVEVLVGEEAAYYTLEGGDFVSAKNYSLGRGDIIMYSKDFRGEMKDINVIVSKADLDTEKLSAGTSPFTADDYLPVDPDAAYNANDYPFVYFEEANEDYGLVFGYVTNISGSRVTLSKETNVENEEDVVTYVMSSNVGDNGTTLNMFLSSTNRVKIGDIGDANADSDLTDDLIEGDFILGRTVNGMIRDVVVIKANRA